MKVNIGEFYLIKKYNKDLNINKFIGEIQQVNENQFCKLKIYIFPESTKKGRQSYNGFNEVFTTSKIISYQFNASNETKIELIQFERYVNLKLKNKQIDNDIYFYRQSYSFEDNKFKPEKLPLLCYCKKIFNPDIPFKQCVCGNLFHVDCFIKENTNECWAENCHYNCNKFLDTSQQIQKLMSKSNNNNKTNTITNNNNDIKKSFYQYEYKKDNNYLNKESKKENIEIKKDNSFNSSLNISKQSTSYSSIKSHKSIRSEIDSNIFKNEKKKIIKSNSNRIQEEINREKGEKIISNVLLEGLKLIESNNEFKRQYELSNYKNKLTNINLKEFSQRIEKNLFYLYKSNSSLYRNFLQELTKMKKNSKDLLSKIIIGIYTPEQISNFKVNDFLTEEKKKEIELLKNSEIEKMKIKDEDNKFNFSISKGNLITLREEEIEQNLENENINLNISRHNSSNKIMEKQKQFPNLKPEEIKNLINLEKPSVENVKNKLEQIIKQNWDINTINYFKEKRNNILMNKVKRMVNQDKKKNSHNNQKDINNYKENIENKDEYDNKINEYLNKISFTNLNIKVSN